MIRGPSGGGKTTLVRAANDACDHAIDAWDGWGGMGWCVVCVQLNIIGTIDEPTSGSVSVFGSVVDASSSDAYLASLRLNKIGFVFQTFNLLATLSAYEVRPALCAALPCPALPCPASPALSWVGLRAGWMELNGAELTLWWRLVVATVNRTCCFQ
jgi:ABC-type transporter Mla maintaining outer membrane lipid asymmetry ATPase subunit MlaF